MDKMVKLMIPFKVRLEPLPDNIWYRESKYKERKIEVDNTVWTVVAIKTNPQLRYYVGAALEIVESCFTYRIKKDNVSIPCDLFLLFHDGETPFWYPSIYCKAVE